jgi:hypothetical protein
MSEEAGGYDFICGSDRRGGKLVTSDKNELLQIEDYELSFLLTHSAPVMHHYEGMTCDIWDKGTCDKLEVRYTFQDHNTQIIARCQSWLARSWCGSLHVGTSYNCDIIRADRVSQQSLYCFGTGSMEIDASDMLADHPR